MNKNTKVRVSGLTENIIEQIERCYPERSPDKHETDRDLTWRGGQIDVVRFLRRQYETEFNLTPSQRKSPCVLAAAPIHRNHPQSRKK